MNKFRESVVEVYNLFKDEHQGLKMGSLELDVFGLGKDNRK